MVENKSGELGENKKEYYEWEGRKHGQTLGWSFERVESKKGWLKKVHGEREGGVKETRKRGMGESEKTMCVQKRWTLGVDTTSITVTSLI